MNMKNKHFFIIAILLIGIFFVGRYSRPEQPIETNYNHIRDSLSSFYKEKYKEIDSIEVRQNTVIKYRTKTIQHYDTIIINIPNVSVVDAFANYSEL